MNSCSNFTFVLSVICVTFLGLIFNRLEAIAVLTLVGIVFGKVGCSSLSAFPDSLFITLQVAAVRDTGSGNYKVYFLDIVSADVGVYLNVQTLPCYLSLFAMAE